jgi:hypothetical protein
VVDGVFIFIFIFIKVPVIFWCCVVLCCVDRTFLRVDLSKRRRNLPSFRARGGLPCLPSLPHHFPPAPCTLHFALAPAKPRLPFPTELISTALNSYNGLSSPCPESRHQLPPRVSAEQSITICCVCIIWSALSALARVPPTPHCPTAPLLPSDCRLFAF